MKENVCVTDFFISSTLQLCKQEIGINVNYIFICFSDILTIKSVPALPFPQCRSNLVTVYSRAATNRCSLLTPALPPGEVKKEERGERLTD